jgi:hypothetical protein
MNLSKLDIDNIARAEIERHRRRKWRELTPNEFSEARQAIEQFAAELKAKLDEPTEHHIGGW